MSAACSPARLPIAHRITYVGDGRGIDTLAHLPRTLASRTGRSAAPTRVRYSGVMERVFAVLRSRGPAWDEAKPLEGQAEWAAHAAFMDALFDTRFAAFAGPLEGTRDALLILRASSASEIVERLASDPWTANGLLITKQISPWQLRLGSLIP
jgi:uncharacterized protein YciI